jgi:hypothetical protein
LQPIPEGTAVAIEVAAPAPAAGPVPIENRAVGHDLSAGSSAGAVAGGLWGLACGPWAPLCVPALAGLGAATGAFAGAGVGLTGALSREKAAKLRGRLDQSLQTHSPADELRRSITDRARLHWRVAKDDAAETVTVELTDLVLNSTRDEQIGFVVSARVRTQKPGSQALVSEKLYQYAAPASSLSIWLDERNDFVDTNLRIAMQHLAAQIVAELARK